MTHGTCIASEEQHRIVHKGEGDRLTVCGAVLKHKSFVAHHHERRAINASSHCCGLLGSIVLGCGWCGALVQFMDLLVQVSHVLDARVQDDCCCEIRGVRSMSTDRDEA